MTPKTVDRRAKRQEILKAALGVFARKGLYDFKMIDVAQAAGIGKGTIYEYFPSKDELIIGCFTQFMEEFDHHVSSELAALTDPAAKLRRLVSASLEFCLSDQAILDALFDFYAAAIPRRDGKALIQGLVPMYRQMIDHVAVIIEEGVSSGAFRRVDSRLVASAVLALLDGLFFQASLGVIDLRSESLADRIGKLLLAGLVQGEIEA